MGVKEMQRKVTGVRETCGKAKTVMETGGNVMGLREKGGERNEGVKIVQDSQVTGGKGDMREGDRQQAAR